MFHARLAVCEGLPICPTFTSSAFHLLEIGNIIINCIVISVIRHPIRTKIIKSAHISKLNIIEVHMSFIRRYGCLKRKSKYRYVIFICLFIYLFIYLFVHLFIYLFIKYNHSFICHDI